MLELGLTVKFDFTLSLGVVDAVAVILPNRIIQITANILAGSNHTLNYFTKNVDGAQKIFIKFDNSQHDITDAFTYIPNDENFKITFTNKYTVLVGLGVIKINQTSLGSLVSIGATANDTIVLNGVPVLEYTIGYRFTGSKNSYNIYITLPGSPESQMNTTVNANNVNTLSYFSKYEDGILRIFVKINDYEQDITDGLPDFPLMGPLTIIFTNNYIISGPVGTTPLVINGITITNQQSNESIELVVSTICVRGDTLVQTETSNIQIKNIRANDMVVDATGKLIKVVNNIRSPCTSMYIKINKNAFGEDKPSQDLWITPLHPILIGDKEIDPQLLINNDTITRESIEKCDSYSLCTDERTFVMMNNVPVCTWAHKDYQNRISLTKHHNELL